MADTKLKPCPFCGGEAHIDAILKIKHTLWKEKIPEYAMLVSKEDYDERREIFEYGYYLYMPRCQVCGSAVGATFVDHNKAIEAWNRRVNDG